MNTLHMKIVYRFFKFCLFITLFSALSFSSVKAQTTPLATEGSEFWFAFLPHTGATNIRVMVTTTQPRDTVTISMPANAVFTEITEPVTAAKASIIDIPIANIPTVGTGNFGFKLTSNQNVSVTLLNSKTGSLDGTTVFPQATSSSSDWSQTNVGNFSDYFITTPEQNSAFVVVATTDATEVFLTPSGGTATTVTLNRGQTHVVSSGTDLSCYRVQACKPVVVFSGGETLNQKCVANNHMASQMYPFETWGTRFFTVPTTPGTRNYGVKIVSSTDGNIITIDSLDTRTITLKKGECITLDSLTRPACFESTAPISITQFMKGNTCNGTGNTATGLGNPAMVVLNHMQQGVNEVTFAVDTVAATTSVTNRFLSIIVPDGNQNGLQVNGQAIPATSFTPYTVCTDFVHATVDLNTLIPSGIFSKVTITGGNNFLAYIQGRSANEEYIYSAGYNFTKIPITAAANPNPTCIGTSTTLAASGPNNITTYVWTLPDGSTQTGASASYTVKNASETNYTLKATNEAGCNTTINFNIPVDQIVLNLPGNEVVCDSLTLDAGAGFTTYTWNTGATTQTITVTAAGKYSVTVTRGACTASADIAVTSGTKPESKIAVSPDQPTASVLGLERSAFICVESAETITLTADPTNVAQGFSWNTGATTNQITVNAPGTYIAQIQFSAGCVVIDSIVVEDVCQAKFFVPTAFSPNNDNVNDNLQIFGKGFFNLDFRVFNRWGELIYFSKSQENTWDGTAHGFDVPNGTYVWRATYEDVKSPGTKIKKWGKINIVR